MLKLGHNKDATRSKGHRYYEQGRYQALLALLLVTIKLLGARTLPGAPGLTTTKNRLLGARASLLVTKGNYVGN